VITRFGYDVVAIVAGGVLLGVLLAWFFVDPRMLRYGVIVVLLLILVLTVSFFRDPDRVTPRGEGLVIAPADGRVVQVADVEETEYLKSRSVQVSIFMSPLDVHVNRFPISGRVEFFRHLPGKYLVAFADKSSEENERTLIGIGDGRRRVLFKQVAGFIARRIIAPLQVGDSAVAGARFGMIRFGSRVDVIVPADSHVRVKVGDRAVAGETILAVLTGGEPSPNQVETL
jgi:phosphatidylserine decarboxylase